MVRPWDHEVWNSKTVAACFFFAKEMAIITDGRYHRRPLSRMAIITDGRYHRRPLSLFRMKIPSQQWMAMKEVWLNLPATKK